MGASPAAVRDPPHLALPVFLGRRLGVLNQGSTLVVAQDGHKSGVLDVQHKKDYGKDVGDAEEGSIGETWARDGDILLVVRPFDVHASDEVWRDVLKRVLDTCARDDVVPIQSHKLR